MDSNKSLEISAVLDYMEKTEREAAKLVLEAHDILSTAKTGKRDVVTQYDALVQKKCMELLSSFLPDASFFCEELDCKEDLFAQHVFIIDPIDGTMNFVHNYNMSCISIAYASCGVVLAGTVYNPFADEMFTAVKNGGARLNGNLIHVEEGSLSDSVCCCGTSPYHSDLTDKTFLLMRKAFDASLDIRRCGSAALDLCSVAAGRMGAYFELSICLWDYAAGKLLVEEAGGVVTDIQGNAIPMKEEKTSVLAGGMQAHKDFLNQCRL